MSSMSVGKGYVKRDNGFNSAHWSVNICYVLRWKSHQSVTLKQLFLEFDESYGLYPRRIYIAYICKILCAVARDSWHLD